MTTLTARGVGVRLGGADIVTAVDLEVATGQWLSIIGPNGAGKSTLLRALAGVGRSSGVVEVDAEDIAALGPRERARRVAWVPQSPTIPHGMTVLDYVLLGRTAHLGVLSSPKAADLAIAEHILTDLDLSTFANRMVNTLSGGERQRAVIARALTQDAPIILLDEPTTALDLGHQQEVLTLLDTLRGGGSRAIITTMHDLTLAGAYADSVMLMSNGEVITSGSASSVLTEENIATHYGADVSVSNVDGTILVVPKITASSASPTKE